MLPEDQINLSDLFYLLRGSQIHHFVYDGSTLRLELFSAVCHFLNPPSPYLNLVLSGCTNLYYESYTQTLASRTQQRDPEQIFKIGLIIQGVEQQFQNHFTVYCNSYHQTIEAGGLHLEINTFNLYDAAFGRISLEEFCQASDKTPYIF